VPLAYAVPALGVRLDDPMNDFYSVLPSILRTIPELTIPWQSITLQFKLDRLGSHRYRPSFKPREREANSPETLQHNEASIL